jgi:hypothetical protein
MDNYTTFFVIAGIASVSWQLCKFIFWLDNPKNHKSSGGN